MKGRRLGCVGCVLLVAAIAATCVRASTDECANGSRCANGLQCVEPADGSSRCANQDQLDACVGNGTGSCMLGDNEGVCLGGACFVAVCGDGVIDVPESCDDANLVSGDGCSATCRSLETCGDRVIDLARGEQCDEGDRMLAGDGCSPNCIAEYRVWRDVTPSPPTPRIGYGLASDPLEGLVMFGGSTGPAMVLASGSNATGTTLNDTWLWTGTAWTALKPLTEPSRRSRFAMAYDPTRRRVVLFGGMDPNGTRSADTWLWDGLTWTKASPAVSPPARSDASLACDTNRCLLFGGLTGSAAPGNVLYHSDTWAWNGTTWSFVSTGQISARGRSAIAFDTRRDRFVLFGGESGNGGPTYHNDTWEIGSGSAWLRTGTGSAGDPPLPSTTQATAAYDDVAKTVVLISQQQTWLHDGSWAQPASGSASMIHPVAAFDRGRSKVAFVAQASDGAAVAADWTNLSWRTSLNLRPSGGGRTVVAAFDARRGRTVVVDRTQNTHEWTGVAWRNRAFVAQRPPSSTGAAIAYDARCGVTVTFGGTLASLSVPHDLMWIYDGSTWRQEFSARPPARLGHSMTYDLAHDAIIVFGGSNGTQPLNDLWAWSGATCDTKTWRQIAVTGEWPTAVSNAAVAYDEQRARVVLFGGVDGTNVPEGDTWELDGTTWAKRATTGPSPRSELGMAYDPRRKRIVLFGGKPQNGADDETWEWDGATWHLVATVLAPSPRSGFAMTVDVTGSVIAIGGELAGGQPTSDIVRLRSELSLAPPERCIEDNDTDQDGLRGCDDPDCSGRCAPLCAPNTSCATCGDGVCSILEDYLLCPADCAPL